MVVVDVVLGVACLIALWWRRSHPGAVGVLTAAAAIVSGLAAGPGLIAGFNVALRGSRRAILAVVAVTAGRDLRSSRSIYPSGEPYLLDLFIGALLTAVVLGWGLFARARREQVLALRERAAQLEAEQRLRIEQARDAERRRIAREMHDVLAHRVSLLSLHAGALEFRPDAPPEEIAEAAGRDPRDGARRAGGAARGDRRAARRHRGRARPSRRSRRWPRSRRSSRRAARRACACAAGSTSAGAEAAPAALGRTAYRVVQEGLTNARKHAPAAAVDVTITGGDAARGRGREPARRSASPPASEPLPGAGSGLIGLGERVALAGGELRHGPDASGDFVLRATLPWTP